MFQKQTVNNPWVGQRRKSIKIQKFFEIKKENEFSQKQTAIAAPRGKSTILNFVYYGRGKTAQSI